MVVLLVHEGARSSTIARTRTSPTRPRCGATSLRTPQRRRRRDHLGSHAPGLQLLVPGAGLGRRGPCGDRASGGVRRVSTATNLNQLVFTVDAATGEVVAGRRRRPDRCALTDVPNYPEDPAVGHDRGRTRSTSRPRSVPRCWVRSRRRSTGRSSPTAPRRTVVASRPWATWSPRCSADQTPAEQGGRADRVHEPRWSAGRHGRDVERWCP